MQSMECSSYYSELFNVSETNIAYDSGNSPAPTSATSLRLKRAAGLAQ